MLRKPDSPLSRFLALTSGEGPAASAPVAPVAPSPSSSQPPQVRGTTDVSPISDADLTVLRTTTPTPPPARVGAPQGGTGGIPSTASPPGSQEAGDLSPRRKKTRHERQLEVLRRLDMDIRLEATEIVRDYMKAAELNDDGTHVSGVEPDWSPRRRRVALDGRAPIKQQPGYLAAAVRTLESYHRAEAHRDNAAPVLNADIQILVQQSVTNYPVLKLSKD